MLLDKNLYKQLWVWALVSMFLVNSWVCASGMAIPTYSTNAASTANANSAESESPSTIVGNPAGIIYLEGTQLDNNLFIAQPSFYYHSGKGYYFYNNDPIKGSTTGKIGHRLEIPGLYFSHKINPKIVWGVALYVPFGIDIDYTLDSVLRYNVNQARIISIIFNPTIAFKIVDRHHIGMGIYALYSKSAFRQFADITHGINFYLDKFIPFINGREILHGGTFEGYTHVKGSAWKYGLNLGWLWDITDTWRVGLSFRSKSTVNFKGSAFWNIHSTSFSIPVIGPIVEHIYRKIGYALQEKVQYTFHYPELWQLHTSYQVSDIFNLFGNIVYSKDSRQKTLHIDWNNHKMVPDAHSNVPKLINSNFTDILINFKNTWRFSIGGSYQYSKPLQLRFGLMYAQSAAKGHVGKTAVSPDADRIMLGLGANYQYNNNLTFGISYNFLKLKTAKINATSYCSSNIAMGPGAINCADSRGRSEAVMHSKAHIVGMSVHYKF